MIRTMLTVSALALAGAAVAKLPPLDEAAKAKAAEAAAKTAWQTKVDLYQLCKAQDRVAAVYRKTPGATAAAAASAAAPAAMTATAAPAAAAPVAMASAAKPAVPVAAASAAKPAAPMPVPTAATASQGGSTPVAAVTPAAPAPIPGCAEPGPFAYNAPSQTPLETSGAHSPAGTAVGPPSVRANSAEMAPAKPGTATKP
jgi:hypothetical protein